MMKTSTIVRAFVLFSLAVLAVAEWGQYIDQASGLPYYFNDATGVSTWDRPAELALPTPALATAVTQQLNAVPAASSVVEEAAPNVPMGVPMAVHGDWAQYRLYGMADGKPYWLNSVTGVSTFDKKPQEVEELKADHQPKKEGFHWTPANGVRRRLDVEGWAEYTDPSSGKVYYYNSVTKVSTWEKPLELMEEAEQPQQEGSNASADVEEIVSLKASHSASKASKASKDSFETEFMTPAEEEEPIAAAEEAEEEPVAVVAEEENAAELEEEAAVAVADESKVYTINMPLDREEPPTLGITNSFKGDWLQFKNPEVHHGKAFWYNWVTGESTYEQPQVLRGEGNHRGGASADEEGGRRKLSSEWAEFTDPASGKIYYYNSVTKVSSWEKPSVLNEEEESSVAEASEEESAVTELKAEDVNAANPVSVAGSSVDENDPWAEFPPTLGPAVSMKGNWFQYRVNVLNHSGKPFWYNFTTGESTWEMPEELANWSSLKSHKEGLKWTPTNDNGATDEEVASEESDPEPPTEAPQPPPAVPGSSDSNQRRLRARV